jgi:hypothetical protein
MLLICSRPKSQIISQDQSIKRLIINNKQKCMVCKPVMIKNGKFSKLQDRNKPYIHAANCSQIGGLNSNE